MRFSEKSFELRFCAALSAAMMPFNRNPLWIGMTQAQERANGIDTMIRVGGKLHVFQFKAQQGGAFKLDKGQWRCLDRIAKRYPGSTHYVFPEAADLKAAASVQCLLKHSWCANSQEIGSSFATGAKTSRLLLDPLSGMLRKKRPITSISIKTACSKFGCFCPTSGMAIANGTGSLNGRVIYFMSGPNPHLRVTDPSGTGSEGIPIGTDIAEGGIRSPEAFEEMMGDRAKQDLAPGLFGLFIPSK